MTARWHLKEGDLGNVQGIAGLEIEERLYTREEVESIVADHHAARGVTALQLAKEWQEVITVLAADTAATLELDIQVDLKEKRGHPFWWGKVSVLCTLKDMADADVARCLAAPDAAEE